MTPRERELHIQTVVADALLKPDYLHFHMFRFTQWLFVKNKWWTISVIAIAMLSGIACVGNAVLSNGVFGWSLGVFFLVWAIISWCGGLDKRFLFRRLEEVEKASNSELWKEHGIRMNKIEFRQALQFFEYGWTTY